MWVKGIRLGYYLLGGAILVVAVGIGGIIQAATLAPKCI
jgi:hypothetical protein